MPGTDPPSRLYLVTPREFEPDPFVAECRECRLLAQSRSSPGTMARSAYRSIADRRARASVEGPFLSADDPRRKRMALSRPRPSNRS